MSISDSHLVGFPAMYRFPCYSEFFRELVLC